MPRITKMWGFEEQWPSTVWDAHGFDVSSTSNDDTNFSAWCSTSPTAGFVSGVRSLKIRANDSWNTTGYDGDTWHENTGGAGAYASGRIAFTIMPDNIGGSGYTRTLFAVYARGDRLDGGGASWNSDSWPIARINAVVSGSGWTLTLYVGQTAFAIIPVTLVREQANRLGLDYFWEDNNYYARATANGVAVTEWFKVTVSAITPPGKGIRIVGGGMNSTNSSSGVTGVPYATCYDDIVFISDTITAIDTTLGAQVVTRAEAEPPDPSGAYYVRALDVASINAAAGTWAGAAGDIDIADSDNEANYVETTDTSTPKPLNLDISYDAVSGTAPASYLGFLSRNMESQVTMVTDLQLSEDGFSSTTGVTSIGTPGTSITRREISTTVKANGGGALDKAAIDAMKTRKRVTS